MESLKRRTCYILFHTICLLHILPSNQSAPLSSYLVSSFTSPDPSLPFNNIAVDNVTGDVYIGARERLYHLNPDLTMNQNETVEPCSSPNKNVGNDNKLLVIAPSPYEKLITCWSCDDYCETRDLANILGHVTKHTGNDNQKVVPVEASILGVVSRGSDYTVEGEDNKNTDLYLFTGRSYSRNIISSPISKHILGDLSSEQASLVSSNTFENNFIKIIVHKGYIYYIIQRTDSTTTSSLIGRLCPNSLDVNLNSYTEIEIQCTQGHNSFSVIEVAHVGPAGSKLADSIGLDDVGDILYAGFTTPERNQSALCVFPMDKIQEGFENSVYGCISGNYSQGTANNYISESKCNNVSKHKKIAGLYYVNLRYTSMQHF